MLYFNLGLTYVKKYYKVGGMNLPTTLHKALQQGKIARYKTYKKIGGVGHRKSVDRTVLTLLTLLLFAGAYFILRKDITPVTEEPAEHSLNEPLENALNEPVEPDLNEAAESVTPPAPESLKAVPSDLNNAEIIEEKHPPITIQDVEDRVRRKSARVATITLKKNESFAKLLDRVHLTKTNQAGVLDAMKATVGPGVFKKDTNVNFFFDSKDLFLGLSVGLDNQEYLNIIKNGPDDFVSSLQKGISEFQKKHVSGKIERTFSGSAQKYGVPKQVVTQLLKALDSEINLRNGVRKGDTFDIVYSQKVTPGGLELEDGRRALFLRLKSGRKEYYRYLYTDKSGTSAFYDQYGQRGYQVLLQKPLSPTKIHISSPFGWRMHPVLMYRVFHSGVDLACSRNTPVKAAGDGVIVHLGPKGAYGKYIKIKHTGNLETAYGHLQRYNSKLKVGSRVKQGDIIAYVGSSGRATGPHLHYEVWKNGKTSNPFNTYKIAGKQLSGRDLKQFKSLTENIKLNFQIGDIPPIPPMRPKNI